MCGNSAFQLAAIKLDFSHVLGTDGGDLRAVFSFNWDSEWCLGVWFPVNRMLYPRVDR